MKFNSEEKEFLIKSLQLSITNSIFKETREKYKKLLEKIKEQEV